MQRADRGNEGGTHGRVGRAVALPLFKPDMRISPAMRGFPGNSHRRHAQCPMLTGLQVHQPHPLKLCVIGCSWGWTPGALATPRKVAIEPLPHVAVDLSERLARVPPREVV
jgi:hypothetical protein